MGGHWHMGVDIGHYSITRQDKSEVLLLCLDALLFGAA